MERLEVVGAYPEDRDKQHELRKKQAAQSDEDKGVEETARGPCLLVAPEEEKQCHQEGGGCQVSRIQHVQAGADGYQQEVDRSLYRCPHPDDGERIVELYQEIPDDGIQNKAEETVCQVGMQKSQNVSQRNIRFAVSPSRATERQSVSSRILKSR